MPRINYEINESLRVPVWRQQQRQRRLTRGQLNIQTTTTTPKKQNEIFCCFFFSLLFSFFVFCFCFSRDNLYIFLCHHRKIDGTVASSVYYSARNRERESGYVVVNYRVSTCLRFSLIFPPPPPTTTKKFSSSSPLHSSSSYYYSTKSTTTAVVVVIADLFSYIYTQTHILIN